MKSFREVIINIRESETWESSLCTITRRGGIIEIKWKKGRPGTSYTFCDTTKYMLVKNEVSFAEAFAAYEEGKEIESKHSKYKYKMSMYKEHLFYSLLGEYWEMNYEGFSMEEIKGKWYIND